MELVRIGDLCSYAKGLSIPRDRTNPDKDIAYLHYGDLYKKYDFRLDLREVWKDIIKIGSDERYKPEQILRDGDIVFTLTSESVEDLGHSTLIVNKDNLPIVSGMETTILHITEKDCCLPSYLNYVFQSNWFRQVLRQFVTGMKVYRVHPRDLMEIKIPMPGLCRQQEICSMLDSISDCIDVNYKINDYLLELSNCLYSQYFPYTVNDDLPLGWYVSKLEQIIEIHDSKRVPLSSRDRAERAKIYPYYGAASIADYVDEYIFDGTYLLLGEDGTVVNPDGSPVVQYVSGKFWVNNHAHVLTGRNGYSVDALYLLCHRLNVTSIVTGAVQPKISQLNLRNLPIICPPIELVESFSSIIKPLFELYRNNMLEVRTLTKMRNQLIFKLILENDGGN